MNADSPPATDNCHRPTAYGLPTLLANILGGVSLVAALNHAQVVAGETKPSEK